MVKREIFCDFALIGEDLELKSDVLIEISEDGNIEHLEYDNFEGSVNLLSKRNQRLAIPGFFNSHIHIGDSFAKEAGYNNDLIKVVAPPDGIKHKLLANTSKKIKQGGIHKAITEMITSGTTYFVDFRERGLKGIQILRDSIKDTPINCLILGRYQSVSNIVEILDQSNGMGLPSYSKMTEHIKGKIKKVNNEFNKPIATHISEVKRDEDLLNKLTQDKIVDILIHGTHLTREDLNKIKKNNLSIILCPRCNGYFGVGFPPINDIIMDQIPVALGTDNVMANNLNLFEEMRYLYYISRNFDTNNPKSPINARELLKMVTINGARIFKVEEKVGSISIGKQADFFTLDLGDPNFYCYHIEKENLYALLVQRTNPRNINQVYIKGELIYEKP